MTVKEFAEMRKKLKADLECGKITRKEFAHAIQKNKHEFVKERTEKKWE